MEAYIADPRHLDSDYFRYVWRLGSIVTLTLQTPRSWQVPSMPRMM